MEYLYSDPSGHHFMNQETYEQVTLDDEILGDTMLYLLPNTVIRSTSTTRSRWASSCRTR